MHYAILNTIYYNTKKANKITVLKSLMYLSLNEISFFN